MATELLTGNQAIARGAFESGVTVATGYPGTPSTEILENAAHYKEHLYCEWAPNEKVALEVAAGAALAGARCIVTMKHVGLNVAADPLMTLSYIGVNGGLVVCVADDPGMHSSQNEQDSRHYARFAKIPVLEPADAQEAKDFLGVALQLSEEYRTPVLLRTTTRVSHSRSLVELGERRPPPQAGGFEKNPPRYVPIPIWGRVMRNQVEVRLHALQEAAAAGPINRIEWRDRSVGIVTAGIAYQYVREAFPEASVLKLGWCYPYPDRLLRDFAGQVKRVLVVEELDDFLEEHIRAMGIDCAGRSVVPGIGELSTTVLKRSRARLLGEPEPAIPALPPEVVNLPARPPVLCAGCPHRGLFYALGKFDVIVTGDIGCYSLGVFPPLSRLDTILCMGAGLSMAHGMRKAGEKRPVVGLVGDSTFFHSGITSLLDIAYNRGTAVSIVADNRTTAMTGHQVHPGTGLTLMGEKTGEVSVEAVGRACGIRHVYTVNPYELAPTIQALREALESGEAALIVTRAPCPLHERRRVGRLRRIDKTLCKRCKACLKLGCPAIECTADALTINEHLCAGCGLCGQVCKLKAILVVEAEV